MAIVQKQSTKFDQLMQKSVQLHQQGSLNQALKGYLDARKRQPKHPEPWHLLGLVHFQRKEFDKAIYHINKALELQSNPLFWFNLGRIYREMDNLAKAENAYRQAISLNPNYIEALENLANLLHSQKHSQDVEALLRKIVYLQPHNQSIWKKLGYLYIEQLRFLEARDLFSEAYEVTGAPGFLWRQHMVMPAIFKDDAEIELWRRRLAEALPQLAATRVADPFADIWVMPFSLGYQKQNNRDILTELAESYRQSSKLLNYRSMHIGNRCESDAPIRVAFVGDYFFGHSVSLFYGEVILTLPRAEWEVTLVRTGTEKRDEWTQRYEDRADKVINLPENLEEAMTIIAEEQLDLIVYPEVGMAPLIYYLAFARLANLQVALAGHPLTSGLDSIDHYISHPGCEPENPQQFYREPLSLMEGKGTFCCYPHPEAVEPASRVELGLPEEGHLYLFPHLLRKLHHNIDNVLRKILERDVEAKILMVSIPEALQAEIEERLKPCLGVHVERLVWLPFIKDLSRFYQILQRVDVVLDSWPFSGGRLSFDAFAMGTPIVTLSGPEMRGRQTVHLYQRMGIEGAIAESPEEYVNIALELGQNPERRNQLSREILKANARIFDDMTPVIETQQLLRELVMQQRKDRLFAG